MTLPQPYRIEPKLPPAAMQTYAMVQPKATHFRVATCAEVDCQSHRFGWVTTVDVSTELGGRQANYIRLKSGRHFTVSEMLTMVSFTFAPGQECFATHRLPVGRPPLYVKRGGDWRAHTSAPQRMRAEDFVDDWATNLQSVKDAQNRG